VPRQRRLPGLDAYATVDIIAAARRGEIPATIAGRFLAYRLGPARPDQAPEDAWRLGCTRLPYAYPGLNSEAP
jgi:hypothetical protein